MNSIAGYLGQFLLSIFLVWVIVSTFTLRLSQKNDKLTEDDINFAKRFREHALVKTIITLNSDGSESMQMVYEPEEGDGRPWGLSGIC